MGLVSGVPISGRSGGVRRGGPAAVDLVGRRPGSADRRTTGRASGRHPDWSRVCTPSPSRRPPLVTDRSSGGPRPARAHGRAGPVMAWAARGSVSWEDPLISSPPRPLDGGEASCHTDWELVRPGSGSPPGTGTSGTGPGDSVRGPALLPASSLPVGRAGPGGGPGGGAPAPSPGNRSVGRRHRGACRRLGGIARPPADIGDLVVVDLSAGGQLRPTGSALAVSDPVDLDGLNYVHVILFECVQPCLLCLTDPCSGLPLLLR